MMTNFLDVLERHVGPGMDTGIEEGRPNAVRRTRPSCTLGELIEWCHDTNADDVSERAWLETGSAGGDRCRRRSVRDLWVPA
ncbi:MAG: hypothetical protein J4G15_00180 [Alphaproteobacteria bacterium]|nr:hypothetical protein [Alphaproteobacteria bacterium]